MRIRFLEARQLIGGGEVTAGDERDFEEAEALAFIGNSVAEAVQDKIKKPVTEATNG